ncbi:MAG: TasA family protein [bacterium]|nr:TasA family protein [bacterium]
MNKRILISLSVIGAVAALVIGGTIAYFSDTETSTGNTFTAGTIDISVDNANPWNGKFTLADMKPSYTDYINFTIQNFGSDPNPVNVWKKITVTGETTGAQSEPECTEQHGCWDNSAKACDWHSTGCVGIDKNDISTVILYDLYVTVYDSAHTKIWWQAIYTEDVTVAEIASWGHIYLGMIPAGGYMEVKQSYHMKSDTTNWAQGDIMPFNIEVKAEQLQGTAWLENKTLPDGGQGPWKIVHGDGIYGTLTYKVKNPRFDFSFTGKAPLASHTYYLIAGWKVVGTGYDVDTVLGSGTTDGTGNITITGNPELGKDMKNVKVWLVPAENWSGSEVTWGGWPGCVANFLWETGLIWYDDTGI